MHKRLLTHIVLFLLVSGSTAAMSRKACGGPPRPELLADIRNDVTSGLGVNTHFVDPKPGVLEMIEAAGLHMIRVDFSWNDTERQQHVYDFSGYDRLLREMDIHHLRAMFILDYGNPLYENADPPTNDAGRAAFGRLGGWRRLKHFAGRHVLWETWNEPDWQFWKPQTQCRCLRRTGVGNRTGDPRSGPG